MDYEYIIHCSIIKHEFLVPWPLDPSIVGCKWVNKCKYKDDMTLDRYKARLVVEGFIQVERIDYNETLFLVVKITSLQVFFFFLPYHVHQLDVPNKNLYMVI